MLIKPLGAHMQAHFFLDLASTADFCQTAYVLTSAFP